MPGGGRGARPGPTRSPGRGPRPQTSDWHPPSPRECLICCCLLREPRRADAADAPVPAAGGRGSLIKTGEGGATGPRRGGKRAISGDPGQGEPVAARKEGAAAGRAERPAGRRLGPGAPGGRGGGWAAGAARGSGPGRCSARRLRRRLPRSRPLAPVSPCQLLGRPPLFPFVVATLRPAGRSHQLPSARPAPRDPAARVGVSAPQPRGSRLGAAAGRKGARTDGAAAAAGRWPARRRRGWRGFIYLPWNQSLQISHSIMKRFTSYGCRHTQYTGGGGGGAEARPGAATDTAAAAAPAAAPAATAAAAPAIFKKHTHARSLLRSPTGASAVASQRRLLQ